MVYLYDACDQISDFCHQQLLGKVRRKISWTEGGNTVYPLPFGERGYKNKQTVTCHQSMMIILFLLLVFDAFQSHKKTKKTPNNYNFDTKEWS